MSARQYVLVILSVVLIPMAIFYIIYNVFLINVVTTINEQATQTGQQAIELYTSLMDAEIDNLSYMVLDDWANDSKFNVFYTEKNYIDMIYSIKQIREEYLMLMVKSNWFTGMGIVSNANNFTYTFFKENVYEIEEIFEIRQAVNEIATKMDENPTGSWFLYEIGDQTFLCSIVGIRQAYSILFMDLNKLYEYQMEQLDETGVNLQYTSLDNNVSVGGDIIISGGDVQKKLEVDYYYIETDKGENYLVVSEYLEKYQMWIHHLSLWEMSIIILESYQWIFYGFAIVMIFMIPICYYLLIKKIVTPIEQLTETMRDIRDNKQRKNKKISFFIRELQIAIVTFYQMLEQINNLKIESYEQESKIQKVELQCMQLQLKPHFFFNCLNLIYSMLELKKYETVQPLVLQTSKYLRYCLREHTSLIMLEEELENVKTYIELINISTVNEIELDLKMEETLNKYRIPNLLIQSFVENSCKYANLTDSTLLLSIQIIRLETEEGSFLDIVIRDNGQGYPESVIEHFQKTPLQWQGKENIGINNIAQRLHLLYENKAQLQLSNLRGGAHSELIIPIETKI